MKNTACATIPTVETPRQAQYIPLAQQSERDQIWDERKAWADTMMRSLMSIQDPQFVRYADRVRDCAEALFFWLRTDTSTGELTLKLKSAPFCHWRHCPICGWRRGLKTKAIIYQALKPVLDQYPTSRWIFLTLTVQNPDIHDLRDTIKHMGSSLRRMMERKNWPAQGWICAIEVTLGKDGNPHPHFHLLLQVPSSYFKGPNYINTREWVRRWREALRADYDPVCDVRVIKPRQKDIEALQATQELNPGQEPLDPRIEALRSAISEVAKYPVKAVDLIKAGPEWLAEFIRQVHGLKFLTSGGTLKGILKDVREEGKQDLVHVGDGDEGQGSDDDQTLNFHWRKAAKQYQRKRGR